MKDAKLLDFGSIQEDQDDGAYKLIFQNLNLKTFLMAPEATMLLGKDAIQQKLPSETLALAQPFLGHAFHQILESAVNAQKWHYIRIVFKSRHLLELPYQHLAFSPLYNFFWGQIQKLSSLLQSSEVRILQSEVDVFTTDAIVEIIRELPNNERLEILQKVENASNGSVLPKTSGEFRQAYATAIYQLANRLHKLGGDIEAVWKLILTAKHLSENDLVGNEITDLYLIVKQKIERRDQVKDGGEWKSILAKIVPIVSLIFSISLYVINKDEASKKLSSDFERIGNQQHQIREKERQEIEKYAAFTNNFFEDLYSQTKQFAQNGKKKDKAQRPETGEYVYTDYFYAIPQAFQLEAFEFLNDSNKDVVLFIRNDQSKFVCAARYVRSHESLKTVSLEMGAYELLIANGKNWTDNLSDDESDPLPGFTKDNDFFGIYDKSKKSINGYKMEVDRQHLEVRKLIFDGKEIGVNWQEK